MNTCKNEYYVNDSSIVWYDRDENRGSSCTN